MRQYGCGARLIAWGMRSGLALALLTTAAAAQKPSQAQIGAIRQYCRSDYRSYCSSVPTGGAAALQCLQKHAASLSGPCQKAVGAISTPAPNHAPAPAPPQQQQQQSSASVAAQTRAVSPDWPHTLTENGATVVVYQPQVTAWPDRAKLVARAAVAITGPASPSPFYGTLDIQGDTTTDFSTRSVVFSHPTLVASHFPSLDTERAAQVEQKIRSALTDFPDKTVPLDSVLLSLDATAEAVPNVEVNNDPPRIFHSERPASLVVFDGKPVLAPVEGSTLQRAVNTNWPVLFDPQASQWFLLANHVWYATTDPEQEWHPTADLPPALAALPADPALDELRKNLPAKPPTGPPATIFVSLAPAVIIVTAGPPIFAPIPGTGLEYVSNTDSDLFRADDRRLYYLVSGRWFSAQSLDGPWSFATSSLPPGFAEIPPDSPRGRVLASVPGTQQAQETVLQASIPHQATLSRSAAKLDVSFAGDPKFEPIAGTGLSHAVNSPYGVIKAGDAYFVVWQGAWFTAPAPTGPWVLADAVPAEIYAIPPSSPLYPVTYVRVYAATPETVTYGYTAGYAMGFVSAGVLLYGTGYYYPPTVIAGPVPAYFPYPYAFASGVYYNPTAGAWTRSGAVYGPYGGAAEAGSYYNPSTGAYAQGAAIYGPNGGAGAWSGYNPSTGRYAQGTASWGAYGGTAHASFGNTQTGVSGYTTQNANAYGRWGSSVVSGPNQTVNTASGSNARGSAGAFQSSTGAQGAAVHGAGGNSAGVAKGAGGNVYAGANGNVYQHTSSGWSKWNNGGWNPVQQPTAPARSGSPPSSSPAGSSSLSTSSAAQSRAPGQTNRPQAAQAPNRQTPNRQTPSAQSSSAQGRLSQGEYGQLEQDRAARTQGAFRQRQFSSSGGGFGGFRSRGGGEAWRRR